MEMCDQRQNITMCPLCDKTCSYWKMSSACATARASHLFDNPATVFFSVFMALWGKQSSSTLGFWAVVSLSGTYAASVCLGEIILRQGLSGKNIGDDPRFMFRLLGSALHRERHTGSPDPAQSLLGKA